METTPAIPSSSMAMGSHAPTVDHELEMAQNRIRALVYKWMSIWDSNTGAAGQLLDLLSPEGIHIELVEEMQTIDTVDGVRAWFARFPKLVKQDNHIVESIEVNRLEGSESGPSDQGTTRWRAVTRIRGVGVSTQEQPFLVFSDHDWVVVDYGGDMPRIAKMAVRLVRQS